MVTTKTRTTRSSPRSTDGPEALIAKGDRATAYAADVLAGRILAGPHVRNACRRHLEDLNQGPARGLTWDLAAAKHVWSYFEGMLRLSEGQFEGQPFRLGPSQAFKLGSIFGWKNPDGTRRFRRAFIEEGKGNGKSPMAGGIGLYGLASDGEAGAQIYAAAAKKEQSAILFQDAVKMVRRSPALARRLAFSGGLGREFNIAHHSSQSFFRPISKEAGKTGSGPRPHFALCDEVHEHPDRTIMEMLERGFKFRRQPLLVMITNSGSDRNSACWEEHEHAVRVAAGTRTPGPDAAYVGEVIDDTTFAYVCALDLGDDPLADPTCWIKTNPMLDVILSREYLAGVVAQAKDMPGKLNGVLRLHFCVWTDADEAWIKGDTLRSVLADFDPAEHHGKDIFLGVDLSETKDLTAVAHVVKTGEVEREREDRSKLMLPTYDAWVEAWTPKDTIHARAMADSAPYDVWANEYVAAEEDRAVYLRAVPGPQIRLDYIAVYIGEVDDDYTIKALAYDRYSYRKLEDELAAIGKSPPQMEHPQAGRKRAKPTDEQIAAAKSAGKDPPDGLWMPGSLNALETLILEGRIRLKNNPVLVSACMSAALGHDPLDNRWFEKRKSTQKIDALVSLAMAVGAAEAAPCEEVPDLDDFLKNVVMV